MAFTRPRRAGRLCEASFPLTIARRRQTAAASGARSGLLGLWSDRQDVGLGAAGGVVDHFGDDVDRAEPAARLAGGDVRKWVYLDAAAKGSPLVGQINDSSCAGLQPQLHRI